MGIIQRQGIKNSVVNYLGAAIGMLSTLLVYNQAADAYGVIQFIKTAGLLFLPLANWGIQNVTVRFFPVFRTEDRRHQGFLSFLLLAAGVAYLVFVTLVFFFWDPIYAFFASKKEAGDIGLHYIWYFVPLTYLLALVNTLTNYISNFQRIVVPAILHDLFLKLVLPILILLYAYELLSLVWIIRIFLLAYVAIVLFLLLYLRYLGELHFKRPQSKIWEQLRSMADFAGFSMLGSLGSVLALQLDVFMMGGLDSWFNTGVYAMAITITMVMTIPQRSIVNISAPIVADLWQQKNTKQIGLLYRQTSMLLLIAGLFFLLEIAVNFPDLCAFIGNFVDSDAGETLLGAYSPMLILAIGRLVDVGTSLNGHIIQYSERYRVNIYFIVFLGAVNIVLNLILIPRYGMNGAAAATTFSLTSYNILRTIYVKFRFGMLPFDRNTLGILLVAGLSLGIGLLLPQSRAPLLNMLYRGAVIAFIFLGLTYYLRFSLQFNEALNGAWERFRKFINR